MVVFLEGTTSRSILDCGEVDRDQGVVQGAEKEVLSDMRSHFSIWTHSHLSYGRYYEKKESGELIEPSIDLLRAATYNASLPLQVVVLRETCVHTL